MLAGDVQLSLTAYDSVTPKTTQQNLLQFTSVVMLVTFFLDASLPGVGVAKEGKLSWR